MTKKCSNSNCARAGQELPLDEFYTTCRRGIPKKESRCKDCIRKQKKEDWLDLGKREKNIKRNKEYRSRVESKEKRKIRTQIPEIKLGIQTSRKRFYQKHKQTIKEKRNTPSGKFIEYKADAKRRALTFEIDLKFATELFLLECYYCSFKSNIINGIDRINNAEGYIKENCVSCCEHCNRIKLDYSVEEMWEHIEKMLNYRNTKK